MARSNRSFSRRWRLDSAPSWPAGQALCTFGTRVCIASDDRRARHRAEHRARQCDDRRSIPHGPPRARRGSGSREAVPLSRPSTAQCRRPESATVAYASGLTPSPSGRPRPAPDRSRLKLSGRAIHHASPCGAPRRSLRFRMAAGRSAGNKRLAEAVDIRPGSEAIEVATGLLRAHVCRCPYGAARKRRR